MFGSVARVLVPPEKRKKTDEKSIDMVLLGFTETGYVLYDVLRNKFTNSSCVEVDETRKIHDVINDHLLKTSVSVSVSDVNIVPTVTPVSNVDSAPGCSNWINPDELTEAERSGDNLVDRSLIDTSSSDERSDDFACFALAGVDDLTYEEALNGPESKFWRVAIDEELKAMEIKDVWYSASEKSVNKENYSKVDSKWVLKKKINSNGGVKFKARLVLRGFKDNHFYELDEIYAPTPNQPIIRSMLNLAMVNKWQLRQLD
ncbi:unnamed protein product, partial [Allacma fusca]